jgi:Cu/Ag efflux protein CusF
MTTIQIYKAGVLLLLLLLAIPVLGADKESGGAKYTCPMHPHYIADEMGACPICGGKYPVGYSWILAGAILAAMWMKPHPNDLKRKSSMKKSQKLVSFVVAVLLFTTPVLGESHSGHSIHGHDDMTSPVNQGVGKGVLHKIDVNQRTINLTHGPIPELKWMGMTMDLPVTKRVDLSAFKVNDKVVFTVKKGRDKQFRITAMELENRTVTMR